jgi:hypothetical protein
MYNILVTNEIYWCNYKPATWWNECQKREKQKQDVRNITPQKHVSYSNETVRILINSYRNEKITGV